MSRSAPTAKLEELHALVAKVLSGELQKALAEGAEAPSPQLLAQAIKFLKDNGIEPAKDVDNAALNALVDTVNDITKDPAKLGEFLN